MIFCKCESWKKSMKYITGAETLAYHHGWKYEGDRFRFCPWCGKKVKNDTDEKVSRMVAGNPVKSLTKKARRSE